MQIFGMSMGDNEVCSSDHSNTTDLKYFFHALIRYYNDSDQGFFSTDQLEYMWTNMHVYTHNDRFWAHIFLNFHKRNHSQRVEAQSLVPLLYRMPAVKLLMPDEKCV
jgi:hypothetical protein